VLCRVLCAQVWNSVDQHSRRSYTSVIHGKYSHEETIATASFADTYVIVRDLAEAQMVSSSGRAGLSAAAVAAAAAAAAQDCWQFAVTAAAEQALAARVGSCRSRTVGE
jgi:4-hydroxy-3-methylbut-2-enyl diphosphate reductase IspH